MASKRFVDVYNKMGMRMESINQKASLIKKLNKLVRTTDCSDLIIKFKTSEMGEIALFHNEDVDDAPTMQDMVDIMSSIQEVIKTMITIREAEILKLAKEIGTLEEKYDTEQATQFIKDAANFTA